MKISKSKKELARIISENGGWREGAEWAAQDKCAQVTLFKSKPVRHGNTWLDCNGMDDVDGFGCDKAKNWHQTILSREEYFHLYPATDDKPSIEKLAADYRNSKDYAERRQREADDAKADADARLKALGLAGEAIGLLVSPITSKQEIELVITDWRDLQVGDEIESVVPNGGSVKAGDLGVIVMTCTDRLWADFPSQKAYVYFKCHFERGDVKFIRRP